MKWEEEEWFQGLVDTLNRATLEALAELENEEGWQNVIWHFERKQWQAGSLSKGQLVKLVARRMVFSHIAKEDMIDYEPFLHWIPALEKVPKALKAASLHDHIKIGPTPADQMKDHRWITPVQFVDALDERVFGNLK